MRGGSEPVDRLTMQLAKDVAGASWRPLAGQGAREGAELFACPPAEVADHGGRTYHGDVPERPRPPVAAGAVGPRPLDCSLHGAPPSLPSLKWPSNAVLDVTAFASAEVRHPGWRVWGGHMRATGRAGSWWCQQACRSRPPRASNAGVWGGGGGDEQLNPPKRRRQLPTGARPPPPQPANLRPWLCASCWCASRRLKC